MPIPSLIKRLSRKSAPVLNQSNNGDLKEPQRPPTVARSQTDSLLHSSPPNASNGTPGQYDAATAQQPNGSLSSPPTGLLVDSSPPPMSDSSYFPPNDGTSREPLINGKGNPVSSSLPPINGAMAREPPVDAQIWDQVTQGPKVSKTDKMLQGLEEKIAYVQEKREDTENLISGVGAVLKATGGAEVIEKGVSRFLEGSTILLKALDEVARIHPFVGAAVVAFKAVWTLEMKRRENDKKIIALYVEMKNMMTVLLQLKGVEDPKVVAPDKTTIEDRMTVLIKATAEDIKECANACDTYSKKKLVVKVIKGALWEPRLLEYVEKFTNRRDEFEFALSIHTALAVDTANRTLKDVDKTTQDIKARVDAMTEMFQKFMSHGEREIVRYVEAKGGPSRITHEQFVDLEVNVTSSAAPAGYGTIMPNKSGAMTKRLEVQAVQHLKEELGLDPDEAINKNMTVYLRKFEIQKREITEEVSRIVKREGDRMIKAVTSGPHDRIIDPNVHKIWEEMRWRGSIKARLFIWSLRDYFHEKWYANDSSTQEDLQESSQEDRQSDEWALAYLNVIRLQPISEAFDDDASGFITVAEANTFTTSRPLGWSLPHWIAYWAIGWHQSMVTYVYKTRELISKMFAILPSIRPANLSFVHQYLERVDQPIITLQESVNPCDAKESLRARFNTYVEAEEKRLVANLEAVNYYIDAMDTLALITGPGRIERFLLPLIYLLLKRHFEIFRVCQNETIHPNELWNCADSLERIFDAVTDRVITLQTIFQGQKLNLKHHFKIFANGVFRYVNDPNELWSPARVKEIENLIYPYNDKEEDKNIDIEKLLNHPLNEEELDFAAYEVSSQDEQVAVSPAPSTSYSAILGTWYALMYLHPKSTCRSTGLFKYVFHPSTPDSSGQRFTGSGWTGLTHFSVTGECSPGETPDIVNVSFRRAFPARFPPQYFKGQWNAATDSITGQWGPDSDHVENTGLFVLKRTTTPENLRFLPAPVAFEVQKPRAFWSFALSAIHDTVRRQSWSRSYFKERIDNRKRFIELYTRLTKYGPSLNDAELEEIGLIRETFTVADSRFNHSLAEYQIRRIIGHNGVHCDVCWGVIGGARLICLICQTKETFDTIDLCDRPECVSAPVVKEDTGKVHHPTHDLVKVRRVLHQRDLGALDREAKTAIQQARAAFGPVDSDGMAKDMENSAEICEAEQAPASMPEETGPTCGACQTPVTQPCWYCVQCSDVFICNSCDSKGPKTFDEHEAAHDLVRCQEPVKDEQIPLEDRLSRLEKRFDDHQVVINERFSRVDDRLSRVETLLESLVNLTSTKPGLAQNHKEIGMNGNGCVKDGESASENKQLAIKREDRESQH